MSEFIEYPVGSIWINNGHYPGGVENAASGGYERLPGYWQLIDKKFQNIRISDTSLWTNTSNFTCSSLIIKRTDHIVDIEVEGTTAAALGVEANYKLGLINLSDLGISMHRNQTYFVISADEANALVTGQWYHTGLSDENYFITADIVRNDHTTTALPSGSFLKFHVQYNCVPDEMLDSACDKFYWKRINITTLANTTWKFHRNSDFQIPEHGTFLNSVTITATFTSNSTQYTKITYTYAISLTDLEEIIDYGSTTVYDNAWTNENYKTLTFTTGTDVTSSVAIHFMCANATLQ